MIPTRPRRALIAKSGSMAHVDRSGYMPSSRRAISRSSVSGFARFEWERPVNRYSLVKVQNHNLMGQACAISSFMTLSHGLWCAGRCPAAHRFKACLANFIHLKPVPVDALRKAAGDVSALDLPARELLFCRPAHSGHLLFTVSDVYVTSIHFKPDTSCPN